jgi:hypothetical protein
MFKPMPLAAVLLATSSLTVADNAFDAPDALVRRDTR